MMTKRDGEKIRPAMQEPATIPTAPPRPAEPLVPIEPFHDPNQAPSTIPAPSPNVCPYSPPTEPENCLALSFFSGVTPEIVR
jgi:hypothetical protein